MLLKVEEVSKAFASADGPVHVLRAVSLEVGQGETLALTGESGSGKSTLLTLIAGLDRPDSGRVLTADGDIARLGERDLAAYRRGGVGMIFQQFNLIPSLTVADNLRFQARLNGRHDAGWTAHLARELGLEGLGGRYPEQLSGGQQQRVAVGRTLAARPPLVLADEPTGNLDQATGDRVLDLMLGLVRESGAALLLVTHSARLAARAGRRLHLTAGRLSP